ncbi:MAG: VOC family protein [Terriglobia bacterium]
MIIKIDHLAFSSLDLQEDLGTFGSLGYEALFVEKDLRDLESARPFMKHFSGHVDMALMTRPGSISVELLHYGHVAAEDSYLFPVLEGTCLNMERVRDAFVADGGSFVRSKSSLLKADFFVPEGIQPAEFVCNRVVVDADDIESSADFWCSLGFKRVATGEQITHLEFRSPFMKGIYHLSIRKREPRQARCLLDSQGFNCIAFVTTDTDKERKRFDKLGMECTEAEPLRVNTKDLRIFWLLGPCGEIVELIGLR